MKSLAERLSFLRSVNRSVQADPVLRSMLRYGSFSLLACVQQSLWEHLAHAARAQKRIRSFFSFWAGSITAWVSLVLLVAKMRALRARLLVYGIDLVDSPYKADARLTRLYQFFSVRGISFGEILHTMFGRSFFANMAIRRRPAFYLDMARVRFRDYSAVKGKDPFIAEAIADALAVPRAIRFYRTVIGLVGARAIFAIDDTRYYYPLMMAAQERGIPFYAFQHGRFSKYLPGWAQYDIDSTQCPFPDRVFVWNEYWRSVLLEASPVALLHADRVRIAGRSGSVSIAALHPPIKDDVITFLISHEEEVPENEIAHCIRELLSVPNVRVVYKLRHGRKKPLFLRECACMEGFTSLYDVNAADWARIDAVLGAYSTFLYDALEVGRPVGILETSMTQAYDLVRKGFARIVHAKTIVSDALHVAETPWDTVRRNRSVFVCPDILDGILSGIMPL